MCLIIPGIIVGVLYAPAYLVLLDRKDDFWSSMEACRQMVWDNFGQWLLLCIALAVIDTLAVIVTCGLAIFIVGPISIMAITLAYDQNVGAPSPPELPAGYDG